MGGGNYLYYRVKQNLKFIWIIHKIFSQLKGLYPQFQVNLQLKKNMAMSDSLLRHFYFITNVEDIDDFLGLKC